MFHIVPAVSDEAISKTRNLLREYAQMPGVVVCLADFENELATLPGRYAPPAGRLLLAIAEGSKSSEAAAGCVALHRLDEETCEMKRLYVGPALRGQGAGQELVRSLIAEARGIGYRRMVLDTLPSMREAHQLYRQIGFREIPSYQAHPIPGALFFEFRI
jgi:putative acetyltransferase